MKKKIDKGSEHTLSKEDIQMAKKHMKRCSAWLVIRKTQIKTMSYYFIPTNTLATSCEELTHWKRPWCWEGLGAGGEGDDRGWDGWMASLIWWTWVWVNSQSWWWTGRPGVLRFMGSKRVGHDWATELNWTELNRAKISFWKFVLLQVTKKENNFKYKRTSIPSMPF